ncbi:hypothetical protein V2J09_015879 [Rumex salicifolius]
MCPLRFILVFFSAILAGYFAWRSVRSSPEIDLTAAEDLVQVRDKQERNIRGMIQQGFWVFVDMASGKYLWRNLKEMNSS